MPLTSLDGLLKITVLVNGDRTPLDPLMLYQTAEETVGIMDFAHDQRFEIEWELVAGWNSPPEDGSREYYNVLHTTRDVNGLLLGTQYSDILPTRGSFLLKNDRATHCKARLRFVFWRPYKDAQSSRKRDKLHTVILLYRTDKHGQNCAHHHCGAFVDEMARVDQRRLEQRERLAAEQRQQDVAAQQRAQREPEVARGLDERERLLRQRELAVEQRERELERRERNIVHAAPNPVDENRKPVIPEVQDSGSESRLEGRLAKVEQELASLRSMVRERESRSPSPSEPSSSRKRPRRSNGAL
ncbi:hypothetical protein FFLO_05729 [Filobasidium floriforme]|uniref:Uncharacterized protein n=1 Tax=Filobasidium floriforme TaxID=5210 RepID=A0A8K0JI08_9TREE|nr:hypothetical protein FFLO_05729 [Filobasidium floriforme]